MKNGKKLLALIAALIIALCAFAGCAGFSGIAALKPTAEPQTSVSAEKNVFLPSFGESTFYKNANPEIVPEYVHYDGTDFLSDCEALRSLAEENKRDEALALYDILYDEKNYIGSLASAAFIIYSEDVSDEAATEEYRYSDQLNIECGDAFFSACSELALSGFSEDFKKHVDNDRLFTEYLEYGDMTDREKELCEKETELENEYDSLINSLDTATFDFNGVTYTTEKLDEDYDAGKISYDDYVTVYYGIWDGIGAAATDIYVKLVKIRDEIAELNGYDNYAEFADEKIYLRDYTSEELRGFYNAVKSYFSEDTSSYSDVTYYLLYYRESEPVPADEQIKAMSEILSGISDYSTEASKFLTDNALVSIGSEESRIQMCYTSSLTNTDNGAFIFSNESTELLCIDTLIHEMGHFTHCYKKGCYEFDSICYDVSEIHSTGLEALSVRYLGDYLDAEEAALLEGFVIENLLTCVQTGCLYDEWQREIYANPDMTTEEMNALYVSLCEEYGYDCYFPYDWVFISHNFSSPMYYISYATSAAVTLQLYEKAQTDYEGAVKAWEYFIDNGGEGYGKAVKGSGLVPFSESAKITEMLGSVCARYGEITAPYEDKLASVE